ncbi:FAD-dependent oxidoreductase [Corynebacterium accolens]|uniref:FAD-dependent oxidoreductase n=1 Tax=Corynebacterium accolens TaxID=38284 RepID=A0ABT7FRA7_9CORY|nr:FAD-dependent oxidoreductase [Corynebacterium accolens]MDK4247825.1 FAD-dependent oxidoreductase [Corynebacterium accolens]WKS55017.1 FAD-dependent oxidoreductase [Corynebacterium accolens]
MKEIVVIGAGAIGMASAFRLAKEGHAVTVVDPVAPGSKASSHNAGWVVPTMSEPVPAPGVLGKATKWLLKKDSPLYISPSTDWRFYTFLLRMLQHTSQKHYAAGTETLIQLSQETFSTFDEFVDEGVAAELDFTTMRTFFRDTSGMDARLDELAHFADKFAGLSYRRMEDAELRAYQPRLAAEVHGGIESRGDAHLDPAKFADALHKACQDAGVEFLASRAWLRDRGAGKARVIVDGSFFDPDHIVVAAGAWTGEVVKQLGQRIALQAGKGYGYDFPIEPGWLSDTLYMTDAKVVATPMGDHVRVAGTMGFSGIDESLDHVRAGGILKGLRSFFPDWPINEHDLEPWQGMRPMTPDGLPHIGALRKFPNVVVATGHAMQGISLAPRTAQLVSRVIAGETLPDWMQKIRPERF